MPPNTTNSSFSENEICDGRCVCDRAHLDAGARERRNRRRCEDYASGTRADDAGRPRGAAPADDDAAGADAALSHPVGQHRVLRCVGYPLGARVRRDAGDALSSRFDQQTRLGGRHHALGPGRQAEPRCERQHRTHRLEAARKRIDGKAAGNAARTAEPHGGDDRARLRGLRARQAGSDARASA